MPHIYLIYLVRHNGKPVYVGFTSKTLQRRWTQHCSVAKKNPRYALHRAIRKYGKESFSIEIIHEAVDGEYALKIMEPHFIAEYKTFTKDNHGGYNMSIGGECGFGGKHSDETKKEMSRTRKGRILTIKHRQKISEALRLRIRKPFSEETKKEMSRTRKGRILTIEHRQKISEANKGKIRTSEQRQKISNARKGVSPTVEQRRKISESLMGRVLSEETKKKISQSLRRETCSER